MISKEFDNHRLVLESTLTSVGLRSFIAVHRGSATLPAFGATRFWKYEDEQAAYDDALRLARLMSYKAALANLPYGGAKAVIFAKESTQKSEGLFKAYTDEVNKLHGMFVTGADIGISPDDVAVMRQYSEHIVGVHIDPVKYTVQGILDALYVTLGHVYKTKDISDRTFAVQGLGKIGATLVETLAPKAKKIFVTDLFRERAEQYASQFENVEAVAPDVIISQPVDVFSPCAVHGTVNEHTVDLFEADVILGGANNQLASPDMADELQRRSIIYVPDYVVNAGGLISVVDEYEHDSHDEARLQKRLAIIPERVAELLNRAETDQKHPSEVADAIGDEIISQYDG